jgi:hypothetical protein
MRRLILLTALSLVLAACGGGGGGATGRAGAGGKAVGGAAGDGASGRGGSGGASGGGGSAAGAGGIAVGGAAGGGASGANGSAGDGGAAGGAGDASVADAADGGASDAPSGTPGFDGAADAQQLDGGGTIQSLTLSTNDLVFDSTRKVLYATMNAPDGGSGVVTIDPASGTVSGPLLVGGIIPTVLAISDDCSALYVGVSTPAGPPSALAQIDGADCVRRIDLATMTVGPLVSLGSNTISKLSAGQIAAVPGSSTQYMVSRRQPGFQPDFAGLALFDGSTQLAQLDSFYGSGSSIAFVDQSTLIGCSNLESPSDLDRYSVTSTAIKPGTYVRDIIVSGRTRIAVGSGWIFASDGHAVNATTLAPLGKYGDGLKATFLDFAPIPDPDGATVWFLTYAGAGLALMDFDRTTFELRRNLPLSLSDLQNASAFVRWSPTGFAYRTYDKVYLIKLPN